VATNSVFGLQSLTGSGNLCRQLTNSNALAQAARAGELSEDEARRAGWANAGEVSVSERAVTGWLAKGWRRPPIACDDDSATAQANASGA
jgi:hypothetical protein